MILNKRFFLVAILLNIFQVNASHINDIITLIVKLEDAETFSQNRSPETIKQIKEKKKELFELLGEYKKNKTLDSRTLILNKEYALLLSETNTNTPLFLVRKYVPYLAGIAGCAAFFWYAQQTGSSGLSKGRELLNTLLINPLKSMHSLITGTSLQTEDSIFTTNTTTNKQAIEELFTKALTNAQAIPKTSFFMHNSLQKTPIERLTFSEKEKLFTQLTTELFKKVPVSLKEGLIDIKLPHCESPEMYIPKNPGIRATRSFFKIFYKHTIGAFIQTPLNLMTGDEAISINLSNKNNDLMSLTTHVALTYAQQKNLQISELLNKFHSILSITPLIASVYALYKGTSLIFTSMKSGHYKAILKNIVRLELELNKVRLIDPINLSAEHRGFCFYLTERLKQQAHFLSQEEQETLQQALDDIQNESFTPDQKITVLECMLKTFPKA